MDVDNTTVISSEEELLKYLGDESNANAADKEDNAGNENNEGEAPEDKSVLGGDLPIMGKDNLAGIAGEQMDAAGGDAEDKKEEPDGEKKEEEEAEFSNIIDYLDKKHNLGLHTEQLPEDLDRAQEAEIVADLFEKMATNAEKQIREFQEVAELLEKDPEVAAFLEAKKQGATLRDFVEAVAQSAEGLGDEDIIKINLKNQYPNMTDEEIKDVIEGYKEKGVLPKMAESARQLLKETEANRKQYEEQKEAQEYEQSVQQLGKMLQSTTNVYGVPLDDEKKRDVFIAATQRDPETGLTYLDQALQSNEGVIMATLGVLHMQDLMKAYASVNTNKRSKRLIEKLFADPLDLQSNSPDNLEAPKFDPKAANSF